MKRGHHCLIIVIFFLFNQFYISAQFNSTYLKLIAKEKYIKTEQTLLKDLQKKPKDVEMNFSMAVLYISQKYPGYNIEKAYEYLIRAKQSFDDITKERDLKRLNKIPINNYIIGNYNDTICSLALKKAILINNTETYNKYLSAYITAPINYTEQAIDFRNENSFKIAFETNTHEAFQEFIKSYPDSKQITEAVINRNKLAFEKVKRLDKIANYKEFINKYADAIEVVEAYDRIHELAYIQAERENTSAAYKYFMDEYPSGKQYVKAFSMMEKRQFFENTVPGDWKKYRSFIEKFPENSWKSFAQDSIFLIGTTTSNLEILNYCVEQFTGESKQKALEMFYKIATMDGEKMSLNMFYSMHDDNSFNETKLDDYKLAALGDSIMQMKPSDFNKPLFESYIKAAAPNEKAFLVARKLLSADIDVKNWSSAFDKAKLYATYFDGKNKRMNDLVFMLGLLRNTPKPILKETL